MLESATEAIEPLLARPEQNINTSLRSVKFINTATAPADDLDTGTPMTTHGLQAKARADVLVANLRSLPERIVVARPSDASRTTVAQVVPIRISPPVFTYAPTTRAIGPERRISVTINGLALNQLLDWQAGALCTSVDGSWVVLHANESEKTPRRNDGRATLDSRGRLRLSSALLARLGLAVGAEVVVLVLPEHNALALCNPAWMTVGAPLSLVSAAPNRIFHLEGARQ